MRTAEDVPTKVEMNESSFPKAEIIRPKAATFWGVLRLLMGFTFLWAFLDKAFSLGFATGRNPETGAINLFGPDAWINGGSPTEGFLSFGLHTKEPFLSIYQGLTGSTVIDWIYMLSMLGIGLALMLGIGTRVAAIGGAIWMVIFFTAAALWPENNPLIDYHIIEAVVLVGIAYVGAGRFLGLGNWWRKTELVRKYPVLE
ncbi:MAG TPA: DoxX family protein [Actinomycetota bacterium]|nr:DoxX family protein [Actinomycetota bacterium]